MSLPLRELYYDKVLIRPISTEEVANTGGIIKPQQYEDKKEWGEVMMVGDGRVLESGERIPCRSTVGEIVLFQKYSASKIRHEGVDYLIVFDDDVYGPKAN